MSKFDRFSQLCKFGAVGFTGMGVGLAVLNLCMAVCHNFVASNIAAFLVAVTWNYALNRRVTFAPSPKGILRQWLEFIGACLIGSGVNWVVSWSLYYSVAFFQEHFNLCALIGIGAGYLSNYLLSRIYVFKAH